MACSRHRSSLFALGLSLLGLGCTVPSVDAPDAPIVFRDAPRADAPPPSEDAGPPPMCELDARLGDTCEVDADCDDHCFCNGRETCALGVCVAGANPCSAAACATTSCSEATRCAAVPDDAQCDDGEPCNGVERCDAESGCRAGPAPTCNDASVCTVDACEPGVGCVFTPFDGDGDGEASRTCGGTDCNDRDGAIRSGATEVCDNGVDDDCDGLTDISAPSCALTNDDCSTALTITPADLTTTRYRGTTVGFDSDTTLACTLSATDSRRTAPDAMFRFTLAAARDVTLAVEGLAYNAGVLLREASACESGPDLQCQVALSSSVEPVLHYRSLPAGDYVVVVKTRTAGPYTLAVTLGPATTPRDFCSDDALDVSAGGTFSGAIDDDDYVLPCHTTTTNSYDEAAHRLVVPAGEFRDVRLSATVRSPTGTSSAPYIHLTSACGDADASTSLCDAGATTAASELEVLGLGAGTYYVLVEGAYTSAGSGTYELLVDARPSTGRAPADACDAGVPLPLEEGVTSSIDLAALSDAPDEGAFCSANRAGYRDAYFTFTLAEARDVLVETTSSTRHWLGVSSSCGSVPRVLDCAVSSAGAVSRRVLRLGAGVHFVNVSTLASTGSLGVRYTTFDPTPRPANDLCAGATSLVDGTATDLDMVLYEDDQVVACSAAQDLDAYYVFTLATDRFVTLRAEGATSMALLPGECGAAPTRCLTGAPPQIAEVLPAGTYYVLVELRPSLAGPVRMRFSTSDP